MTVLAGARDPERGRRAVAALRAEGADVRLLELDVTDAASVQAAAKRVDEELGRLDVLVNNAGVWVDGWREPAETTVQALRDTYEVNVFGVVAVTNAMLPLLRQSPAARVVNLSSPLGSLALHADPASQVAGVRLLAYNSSKAALNAITLMYANQLRGTGILVNAVNPGYVATDLNQHQGTLTVQQGAIVPVQAATLAGDGPTGAFLGADGPLPW
jgi:NAD(P)-dependent dehydrogenase (short-subunit alcohol dehydrogenase family)